MLINKATREANYGANRIVWKIENLKNAIFEITDTKLSVQLLEQLKTGFKRTIKWNKYRSQMTVQPQNNNLNYLIDPTFTNFNILFVIPFQRIAGENSTTKDHRDSFSDYYVPNVEIKEINVLIDEKHFFDLPIKNEEKAYEKIIDMSNINDYAKLVIY